jgi:GTP-binding protein
MLTLAIVGRPNVGKSTLFNRLVGRRLAITLAMPGTTRDRIIQSGEWLNRKFWVIDTGGLMPDAEEVIMKEIRTQVELAVAESDVVLLLVDGQEGLNPVDEEIALWLKQRRKPFRLVVNKTDGVRGSAGLAEFYRLGTGDFLTISAEHGTGVSELLEELFARYPEPDQDEACKEMRLVILGRPNVGKSSFLNALLGHKRAIVHDQPGTTRDAIEATFSFEGRNFRIVDTAGIRRKARVEAAVEFYSVLRAIRTIDEADVGILMLDVKEGITVQDKRIAALVEAKGRGMVIVANKADLISADAVKPVQDWLRDTVPYIRYVPIVFTSALKEEGIHAAVRQAAEVYDAGGVRVSKAQARERLLPEFERNPPRHGAQVYSIRQKGVRPPVFALQVSDPKAVNDAYIRFAERAIRQEYGFTGYPVRIRVSR